ncbi:hypothetical protein GYMLUDRAFT_912134 [Collybiopsis luxurians FD-317 M1]|nr:hypothetical protein GYMLUDRAFT_912134 [Collybiopsis luxurians FD-317 M1]
MSSTTQSRSVTMNHPDHEPQADLKSWMPEKRQYKARIVPGGKIIWMSRGFKMTLSEISESYGNLLHLHLPPGAAGDLNVIPLPQRSGKRRSEVQRKCHGYRREEITLTPDAFRNEILIFGSPSINERCCLCGQIVQLFSKHPTQVSSAINHSVPLHSNIDPFSNVFDGVSAGLDSLPSFSWDAYLSAILGLSLGPGSNGGLNTGSMSGSLRISPYPSPNV